MNYTGIVRGGSQRLIKLELSGNPSNDLVKRLDGIIQGLVVGDESLELPAAEDTDYIGSMHKVKIA